MRPSFRVVRPTLSRLRALASLSPRVEAGRSTRALDAGQVELMPALGFARFAVVRHDRGGRVAHRMARDQPVTLEQITVLAMALPATLSRRSDHEPD